MRSTIALRSTPLLRIHQTIAAARFALDLRTHSRLYSAHSRNGFSRRSRLQRRRRVGPLRLRRLGTTHTHPRRRTTASRCSTAITIRLAARSTLPTAIESLGAATEMRQIHCEVCTVDQKHQHSVCDVQAGIGCKRCDNSNADTTVQGCSTAATAATATESKCDSTSKQQSTRHEWATATQFDASKRPESVECSSSVRVSSVTPRVDAN